MRHTQQPVRAPPLGRLLVNDARACILRPRKSVGGVLSGVSCTIGMTLHGGTGGPACLAAHGQQPDRTCPERALWQWPSPTLLCWVDSKVRQTPSSPRTHQTSLLCHAISLHRRFLSSGFRRSHLPLVAAPAIAEQGLLPCLIWHTRCLRTEYAGGCV